MTPWDHHHDLQRDRLIEIGRLIQQGRNNAIEREDPGIGSDPWTVGCEAFAFGKHEITLAAPEHDWLEILQPGMQFVFGIGEVPVRFYKGAPDEPNKRTLRQTYSELQQLSLFGIDEIVSSERLYRFAVETEFDGTVAVISFVVLDGETPILTWNVPLDEPVVRVARIDIPDAAGVDLPRPRVIAPNVDKDEEDDASEG